ncbi:MAG TPA: biotin--[acetyl-CoA-carboxylase] ligase [Xenococcaceae cyanobacterium]
MNFSLELYQQYWTQLAVTYHLEPLKLHIFEILPSTNQKLWELLASGTNPPFAAIALQQTAGRGQWGKTWLSAAGGLYLSVIVQPNITLDRSFHLIMATAWGIADILRSYNFPVLIKWSNDLILKQHKLGGIKLETRSDNQVLQYAVIGVGINWTNTVPQPGINLQTFCQETKVQNFSSLEQLAAITLTGIVLGYQQYLKLGAAIILNNYQKLLDSLGKKINFAHKVGTITGVTTTGELQVTVEDFANKKNIIYLSPGEISLGYN